MKVGVDFVDRGGSAAFAPAAGDEGRPGKYRLVDFNDLPTYMKHNEFILGYYRSEWPWKETFLSIFSIHNETVNIWTHLIGFVLFLAIAAGLHAGDQRMQKENEIMITTMNTTGYSFNVSSNLIDGSGSLIMLLPQSILAFSPGNFSHTSITATGDEFTITRWPFFTFLAGAMLCLLTSSACHLLSCHSEHSSYVMLRLDYAGIAFLIVTSFYPPVYYSFLCHPFYRNVYIGFITVFGLATILVSLLPVFEKPEFMFARAGLFLCMGVSGLVPIVHNLILNSHRPEVFVTAAYEMVMGSFYLLGVGFYVARVPERWFPGKFDITGHSHQLFHALVIAGAYTHYLAVLVYIQWRDSDSSC